MKLSVIICTFNRAELLKKCLASLENQITKDIEVIVVDNHSTDQTKEVTASFTNSIPSLKYVFESAKGLSYARNKGVEESNAPWILFLDDDAIAFDDMAERALFLANSGTFDCVGGMYYGYYTMEKPKWVSNEYGTKKQFSDKLSICPYDVPHGGIVLYRKSCVTDSGNFNPKYGMKGNKIGYGEEIELQKKMAEAGGIIAFDPLLRVKHLVKTNKLSVIQILISAFALGKAHKFRTEYSFLKRLYLLIRSFMWIFIYKIPVNSFKLITQKNYYWQNYILDTLSATFYHLGRL